MRSLIISLNFNPGHVSHMLASYKQCEDLGYESVYYVNKKFVPFLPQKNNLSLFGGDNCPKADLAIFLFPSEKNLPLIWKLKRKGTKIVYIFHEPLAPLSVYKNAGFSAKYLAKLWVIDHISALIVKWSDIVLIPSHKAVKYYEDNSLYKNKNYYYLPLMYSDEREQRHKQLLKKNFSYIGTVAADHSFQEFLEFVEWAVENNRLKAYNFLIATKSEFVVPDSLKNHYRVFIHKGQPMTDEEINRYYASSFAIWNAYARTTQSGVLAKSFMFGTPAKKKKKNMNEFTHDGANVVVIDNNQDKEQIVNALMRIADNIDSFSSECRKEFEKSFYYKVYNNLFRTILKL